MSADSRATKLDLASDALTGYERPRIFYGRVTGRRRRRTHHYWSATPSHHGRSFAKTQTMPAHTPTTANRTRTLVRVLITLFVLILLTIVGLGWVWTASHQQPPLRTASHVVLGIAAGAGILALATIWRSSAPRAGGTKRHA